MQFGLLSPDDIKNFSVAEIKSHEKFDMRGIPKEAGLMDAHLGVPPRAGYRCKTCQGNDMTCPGHYGHINLVKPVFHCGMLTILQKLLSSVCHKCGMLMADGTGSCIWLELLSNATADNCNCRHRRADKG